MAKGSSLIFVSETVLRVASQRINELPFSEIMMGPRYVLQFLFGEK
jgi:hypothetical protein